MKTPSIIKLFESRKGHLDYRVNRDFIRNGVAIIPCQISEYNEVISSYSPKGYEALNQEFVDYVKEAADVTPAECPLVLNIIEDCLTQEEKKTIEETIPDEFAYALGVVEKEEKRHTRIFCGMFIGLIIITILLCITQTLAEEPRELIFIMFYFMGDTLCDYILLTGHDLRRDRQLAGRLASTKVVFSKEYVGDDYTDRDVEQLYSEIEKDVNETIRKETNS